MIGPDLDIPAPDLGTDEQTMAWMMDTYSMTQGKSVPGVVTGKPLIVGGSAGRREATGRGIVYCLYQAARHLGQELRGKKVVVQGFGNVGGVAARLLWRDGAVVVGSERRQGRDLEPRWLRHPAARGPRRRDRQRRGLPRRGARSTTRSCSSSPCDILIPAAVGSQIHAGNADRIHAHDRRRGRERPHHPRGRRHPPRPRHHRDPRHPANAGGVVVSYFEWVQGLQYYFWKESEITARLQEVMARAFNRVWNLGQKEGTDLRTAALMEGVQRVAEGYRVRGLYP